MLRRTLTTLALLLIVALPTTSRAQGVIPGGWAPQFGYEAFAGPGVAGFGAGVGYTGAMFGYGYSGYGGMYPYGAALGYGGYPGGMGVNVPPAGAGFMPPADQAVNAMNPLIHSIRRTTKARRGR